MPSWCAPPAAGRAPGVKHASWMQSRVVTGSCTCRVPPRAGLHTGPSPARRYCGPPRAPRRTGTTARQAQEQGPEQWRQGQQEWSCLPACRLPPAACRLPPAACRLPPAACRERLLYHDWAWPSPVATGLFHDWARAPAVPRFWVGAQVQHLGASRMHPSCAPPHFIPSLSRFPGCGEQPACCSRGRGHLPGRSLISLAAKGRQSPAGMVNSSTFPPHCVAWVGLLAAATRSFTLKHLHAGCRRSDCRPGASLRCQTVCRVATQAPRCNRRRGSLSLRRRRYDAAPTAAHAAPIQHGSPGQHDRPGADGGGQHVGNCVAPVGS